MGNRKQPFGYKMEMGQIVLHSQEAEVVRHIFEQYIAGATYNSLVAELSKQPIHYDEQKPWNKNMIARILEDRRYTGEKGYPAIIPSDSMDAAAQKRGAKQQLIQMTEAQKILRRLSGHTVTKSMERQTLDLLNSLIRTPEKVQSPNKDVPAAMDTVQLERELDAVLDTQPIDEDKAKDVILNLAAAQYRNIGNQEYETQRLYRIFQTASPMQELDAELLQATVTAIHAYKDGAISILLKNNQTLVGSEKL